MSIEYNEDDEELKFQAERVVERHSSAIRNSKVNLRRRKALLLIDKSKSVSHSRIGVIHDDFNTELADTFPRASPQPDPVERRTSIEVALECMMNFDDIIDSNSNPTSDDENIVEDMEGIIVRTGTRSKSIEDLLSVMKIDDDERFQFHLLDNFKQILNHESRHLVLLNTISRFKYILKESKVSDDVLSSIFYNIDDLIEAQNNLVVCLEHVIADWDLKKHLFTDMMDLYVLLHVRCKEYVKNIAHAITELRLLFEKNEKFYAAMNIVVYEGSRILLEVLLAKPTNWLCNSLENIKSLIHAAEGQCNLKMVKETLEKLKDNSECKITSSLNTIEKNVLLRSGMFIEILPNEQRKLRHVFLFSGMLVCAKQKLTSISIFHSYRSTNSNEPDETTRILKHIDQLDTKWFIPLQNLVLQTKIVENCEKRIIEIDNLKEKIRDLRLQLLSEKSKVPECDDQLSQSVKRSKSHNFSFRKITIKKDSERILNQIMKTQTELMLLSPTLSLLVSHLVEKPHNLLLFSIKDLEIWKRDITASKKDQTMIDATSFTLAGVNNLLESYKSHQPIINTANAPLLNNINDEGISGFVTVTIDSVDGLNPVYSYYLSIEVDSFNLNEVKAVTKRLTSDTKLCWNESFDIELDCSHTMNILLYQVKNYAQDKESLLGYFEFKLDIANLDNKTIERTTSIFGEDSTLLQLQVSFKIKIDTDPLNRKASMLTTSLFGVPIRLVVARERGKCNLPVDNVPAIIYACINKIETDGIDEEGIYRISGSKSDISEFYKRLNKNVTNAIKEINNQNLHTITGIVKLYLRELPEPLMLTENYSRLLDISKMGDTEERSRLYNEVLHQLPEPNHSTVVYILKHLQRVCDHSDKNHMVASNLGLIIGPTLMQPPTNNSAKDYTYFAVETMNSMYLSRVFTQILMGVCNGTILNNST